MLTYTVSSSQLAERDIYEIKEVSSLAEFLKPENYLKNAEMAMEDDYGMIDGIINNGKADRIKDMEEKRPSVLEQLKAEPPEIDHPGKIRRPEERNIG